MPELPEVERARKLIEETCTGYKIADVITHEDKLVFGGGITHKDYETTLRGRTILGCLRKGKIFWMQLSGVGMLPIMHFGMTGYCALKGREPDWYIRRPKRGTEKIWPPPKYVKFLLKLEPQPGSVGDEPRELAFLDSRRLGRLKLSPQPVEEHPPISELGFDCYVNPPTLTEFTTLLRKHHGTIKGRLMDQHFSAGVGNWVADEILHLSGVHPAQPIPLMDDEMIERVWFNMKEVCRIAVEANANHAKFPRHWLFSWRWRKGKKDKARKDNDEQGGMRLADGRPATLAFVTVGGRTSAYIEELQKLPEGYEIPEKRSRKGKEKEDASGEESSLSDLEQEEEPPKPTPSKRKASAKVEDGIPSKRKKTADAAIEGEEKPKIKRTRKTKAQKKEEEVAATSHLAGVAAIKTEDGGISSGLSDVD